MKTNESIRLSPRITELTNDIYFLIYLSNAVKPYSDEELKNLLLKSRKKNLERNVTGLLLDKDGCFIQLLEGKRDDVKYIFDFILKDKTHHNINILTEDYISKRYFGDWQKGYRNLHDPSILSLPGFNEFMNSPWKDFSFHDYPTHINSSNYLLRGNLDIR